MATANSSELFFFLPQSHTTPTQYWLWQAVSMETLSPHQFQEVAVVLLNQLAVREFLAVTTRYSLYPQLAKFKGELKWPLYLKRFDKEARAL